jgi:hypothetical protein
MMQAQIVGRNYVDEHPNYQLKGWRCEIDKPRQTPV